jgi:hypothetical protein
MQPMLATPNRHRLRVVYFIPSDRQPEANFQHRLDRIMTDVQQFYRQGMAENGYGELSFELERHLDGALQIYTVQGKHPMTAYGRDAHDLVRQEVKATLARQGIDIDQETIIIFQLLLEWQQNKAIEIGPFVGCGTPHYGTAWVYDDAKLDPQHLASCVAGGYYGSPCSIGQFNSHYLGGVAHELGHAFGLPHDCECDHDYLHRGNSLMSRGNHTYGQEHRGEGLGTFLSAASALPLSVHPLFTGQAKPTIPFTCQILDFDTHHVDGDLILIGKVETEQPVIGVVAHNDPKAIPDDYNAQGWIAHVDSQGQFKIRIGDLRPGDYELRLTIYAQQGESQGFNLNYAAKMRGGACQAVFC